MLKNDFLTTFGASLFIQVCTVLQGVVIARLLGPEGRGEFAAIILWPNVFASIGLLGCHIALAKQAAKTSDHAPLFRTALLSSFFTSTVCSIACYFSIPLLMPRVGESLVELARVFVLFIPLNHFAVNIKALDQGGGNFKIFNLTRIVIYPFYLFLIFLLWYYDQDNVATILIALLLANGIVVCLRLALWMRKVSVFGNIFSLVKTLTESARFGLAGIAEAIYSQADKALMLALLGTESLGYYSVALSASLAVGSITNSAGMVIFTRSAQADVGEGFGKVTKVFRIAFFLWVVLGILLAMVMGILLPLVYGSDYNPAVIPARLLIIGSAFMGLSGLLEQSLRGQGRAFIGLIGKLAGMCVMAGCGVYLAADYGVAGVCVAFVLGQMLSLAVIIWKNNQHYGIPFSVIHYFSVDFRELWKVLLQR